MNLFSLIYHIFSPGEQALDAVVHADRHSKTVKASPYTPGAFGSAPAIKASNKKTEKGREKNKRAKASRKKNRK